MATLIDPTSAAFLLAENRSMPMHVGALQLFEPPEDAGPDWTRGMYESLRDAGDVSAMFLKHPYRSLRTAGQLVWLPDRQLDLEHHVRHNALPRPGRYRELFELCSRLHAQRLAWDRPLWESHVIEGLDDGRVAVYTKIHHALIDGVAGMRLLQSVLSPDPEARDVPAPWSQRAGHPHVDATAEEQTGPSTPGSSGPGTTSPGSPSPGPPVSGSPDTLLQAALASQDTLRDLAGSVRTGYGVLAEAAGMPGAVVRGVLRGAQDQTGALSFHAPRTIFNRPITGSRRFAAEDWPVERLRLVGKAAGTTINDVVLAMTSGAVRRYLLEHDALPATPLVAMVPVALHAERSHLAATDGGNAIGAVMASLGTHLADPADRLAHVAASMTDGKQALSAMTPTQVLAMSTLGQAPAILGPLLGLGRLVRPPYNLVISNVPGPREPLYWNGARLVGTYPLSIPISGMALNVTCTSYTGQMAFGVTGCRRTVPSLQRLLTHLDGELADLENAVGVA
ncbi:WS/DGAT/MGAT family O-acyltransferase [Nocardioides bruguierae]|uniref:WS/DGAT/MGAT family O-acyltransferase n=1 Tax=Nocardioides bruguierae TaxID=2945102 RepID=UPI0020204B93|nr:wax ester/triacylglycerol synthase family O-acyltransferase [Nocardioides bruguierae]MCL8025079.1 wax ester/triacylglycerol synthase family O-acyltransferase [Nocardioides bruguierae]